MSREHPEHGRKLPLCLRKYARGNTECDGRPGARDQRDKMPCVYRERCVALQRIIKVQDLKARDLLKLRKIRDPDGKRRVYAFSKEPSEAFQQRLVRAIDKYGIRNGRVTIKHPKEESRKRRRKTGPKTQAAKEAAAKNLASARKAAAAALKDKAAEDMEATRRLVLWFLSRLKKETGRKIVSDPDKARSGDLFVVDRISKSRYVTVYAKAIRTNGTRKSPTRRPVVMISMLPRSHSVQFRLPVESEKVMGCVSKANRAKIQTSGFEDGGRFLCRSIPVGREGASIMAEAIASAIASGIVSIPKKKG